MPHIMTFIQDDETIRFPQDYERHNKRTPNKKDFNFEN
jgi:hypothetical protein